MLGSFLEGAKATVRRAGSSDLAADSVGEDKNSLRSLQQDDARDAPHPESPVEADTTRRVDNTSAAQSVSRSFSLLRASGARVRYVGSAALECVFVCAREITISYSKSRLSMQP